MGNDTTHIRQNKMNYVKAMIGLGVCLLGITACTTPAKVKTNPNRLTLKAIPQSTLVKEYSRWLPGDAIGVAVIDVALVMDYYTAGYYTNTKDMNQAQAAIKQLKAELVQLSVKRLGVDLTKARQIIVAGGPTWVSVVVTGLEAKRPSTGTELVGKKAIWPFKSTSKADQYEINSLGIWSTELPDGALLMVNKKQALKTMIENPKLSMQNNKGLLERFEGLMPKTTSRMSGVVLTGNPLIKNLLRYGAGLEDVPDDVSVNITGKLLSINITGSAKGLKMIQKRVLDQHARMHARLIEDQKERASRDTLSAMVLTGAHYHMKSRAMLLTPEIKGTSMTYTLKTVDNIQQLVGGFATLVSPYIANEISRDLSRVALRPIVQHVQRHQNMIIAAMKSKLVADQKAGPLATCDATIFPLIKPTPLPEGTKKLKHTFGDEWKPYNFAGTREVHASFEIARGYGSNSIRLNAFMDLKPGGRKHTMSYTISIRKDKAGTCALMASPPYTMNALD